MFDQQDYYSDEEENLHYSSHFPTGKALLPNSGSDFNHLTGQGQSLIKMMQERGLDFNDQQLRKLKASNNNKEREVTKPKQKAGFLDGGASASYEELLKSLNKAFSNADPQQASVILSHILEKKNLSVADRNKFGVMKCKILFGIGAYQDCLAKAQSYLSRGTQDHLVAASFSNYLAKSRAELNQVLEGYMDLLRAKAHLEKQRALEGPIAITEGNEFADSELDTMAREIDHSDMEYNIKMNKYKNATNLVHPFYPQFRHRQVLQVATGDYHTLFLVGGPIGIETETEIFGLGQNSVGQLLGRSSMNIFKQPTLIVELSGQKIRGIAANRQSSCAWDDQGRIYEWGIKEKRDEAINITYEIGEKITQFSKGYQHYAALSASGKFYTWGNISYKGANLLKQGKPTPQPAQNISFISCGNNHVAAVDSYGDCFMMGSNQFGQLGFQGELHAKNFKKLNSVWLGPIRKTICVGDTSFIINRDEEVFFCGQISYNKDNIERPRQGQFSGDINYVSSIAGTIGNYYLTTAFGELYHWDVDSSVKFKIEKENQNIPQRTVQCSHGSVFKVRSLPVPELTRVKQITQNPCSYEQIAFSVELYDRYGPYGSPSYILPPRCQIFLSTYTIKADDLLKQNKLFLDSYQFSLDDTKILVNEIVQSRLLKMKIQKINQRPSCHKLTITTEESGKFYFYVVMEEKIVYSHQLNISVSQRQKQLSQKNKKEKQMREEERKRKAELQRQRLLQAKLRKQSEEEQRRRQTQKRAEQAYKKHLREQEELKMRAEEQRRAKKELLTGGGFDLQKYKAKNDRFAVQKQELPDRAPQLTNKISDPLMKSGQGFLPDINVRPSSRRKVNLPTKNSFNMTSFDSVHGEKSGKIEDLRGTNTNLFKSESNKQKDLKPMGSSKGVQSQGKPAGRVIVKRGFSKTKK